MTAKLLKQCAQGSLTSHCYMLSRGWWLCGCRLALQVLTARRSEADEAEKAAPEVQSAPTAQAVLQHRLALLAEVGSGTQYRLAAHSMQMQCNHRLWVCL